MQSSQYNGSVLTPDIDMRLPDLGPTLGLQHPTYDDLFDSSLPPPS